jgi:protein involved in polysaccharide export with SLBB domain
MREQLKTKDMRWPMRLAAHILTAGLLWLASAWTFAGASERPTTSTCALAPGDQVGVALTVRPPDPAQESVIEPGDVLAVSYHFGQPDPAKPYRLEPGDKVFLHFQYSPELSQLYYKVEDDKISVLSREYLVQPDGALVLASLPKPVMIMGKTTAEVAALLREAYKPLLSVPDVQVSVEPQFLKDLTLTGLGPKKELFQLMTERPVSFLKAPVPSDGKLTLPLVGSVKVSGGSVDKAGREVTARYRELGFERVTVTVWFDMIAGEKYRALRQAWPEDKQPLTSEVLADGSLGLPMIGQYAAAGMTPEEAGRALTGQLAAQGFGRARVWLWIVRKAPPR